MGIHLTFCEFSMTTHKQCIQFVILPEAGVAPPFSLQMMLVVPKLVDLPLIVVGLGFVLNHCYFFDICTLLLTK
jgi:hypothetical protein